MLWWEDLKYEFDRIFNKKYYFEISGYETKLTQEEIDVINKLYKSVVNFNNKLKEISVLRTEIGEIDHNLIWYLTYGVAASKELPLPSQALGKMERSMKANLKSLIDKLAKEIKQFELKINSLSRMAHDIEELTNQKKTDLLRWLNSLVQINNSSVRTWKENMNEAKQAISSN